MPKTDNNFNSKSWLRELCYGVKHFHMLDILASDIRGRTLDEKVLWAQSPTVLNVATKLNQTRCSLNKLIGSEVELIPLDEADMTELPDFAVNGSLRKYDLEKAALDIRSTDLGIQIVKFAAVSFRDESSSPGSIDAVPIAKLYTEVEYKASG